MQAAAAAAAALRAPDSYYEELKRDYSAKKAILLEGLEAAGFIVYPSSGTYFIMVDHTPFGFNNDIEFCEYLIREVGVAAIPPYRAYFISTLRRGRSW
ncbi:unnamed protein product [Miscanthus lutarioriparius]|uniref:Aminotransferase class I/classII large domain-containing protein n=1 Tax=Miscanthus lutarioriparius TaxID=422564 RepID=A0A811NHC8_9POAL|nr:unnamed protein product [Miscanthus lutarioriparius]